MSVLHAARLKRRDFRHRGTGTSARVMNERKCQQRECDGKNNRK